MLIGYVLDLIIGDPHGIPHPVVFIGRLISALEKKMNAAAEDEAGRKRLIRRGGMLWITVILITLILTAAVLIGAYHVHRYVFVAVEAILTCYILAARSLYKESMKVNEAIGRGDIKGARCALSMIVGRDTDNLDEPGIIRAAVETVAENTSDGVIAPLIYTVMGGPVLGMIYKAVNTMDSMLGYRNERFEYFGKIPARMDDVFNYIPSRISALLIVISAGVFKVFGGDYDSAGAYEFWRRDGAKSPSPNSAQTESACAGALGISLGGEASYGGKTVVKPSLGETKRSIENEDIHRAGMLMFGAEAIMTVLSAALLIAIHICI